MKITRDVIADLLPAYVSGEASRDTHALIEEMAARDPEIRQLVDAARTARMDATLQPAVSLPPDLERDIVTRTRTVLRRRSQILALAIFGTCFPFAFTFHDGTVTYLMARDEPGSRLLWLAAAGLWFVYVRQGRLRTG